MKINKKYLKVLIFILASLAFQVFVFLIILGKAVINYEVLNKPKYQGVCIKEDWDYIEYCSQTSDASYTGITYNCEGESWDGCLEKKYLKQPLFSLVLQEYKTWGPLTFLGIGLFFSILVTGYIANHGLIKMKS